MERSGRKVDVELVSPELVFLTSRSSGPGGQNVNKVNSKVTVIFDVENSQVLSPEEKEVILMKLRSRITSEGKLMVAAQEKRSQLQNKEVVLLKLGNLLQKAFEIRKPRKPTRPGKAAKEKRIKQKRQQSEKKQWRQKPL